MTTPSTSSSRNNGASTSEMRTLPQRLQLVLDPEFSNSDLEKQKPNILRLVHNMEQFFTAKESPIEYFKEMASILGRIFLHWPQCRCWFWDDSRFLGSLHLALSNEKDLLEPILQLYSSLAVCGYWAEKLLQNGEVHQIVVESMCDEHNDSIRLEAFRIVQCLAMTKNGCNQMITEHGEPIVKAIMSVMAAKNKRTQNYTSILKEACHLALITRWEGPHHLYFWEAGVAGAIFYLLLGSSSKISTIELLPPDIMICRTQIGLVKSALENNRFHSLTPYIWDILGWLATHCADDFDHTEHNTGLHLKTIILCACISFGGLIELERKFPEVSLTNKNANISPARAVFMMLNSPSTHIASTASYLLSKVLKTNSDDDSSYILKSLATCLQSRISVPHSIRLVIKVITLGCRSSMLEFQGYVIRKQGVPILLDFIRWWLTNPIRIKRSEVAKHLENRFTEQCCCVLTNSEERGDWEGDDIILLCSLYSLDKLSDLFGRGVLDNQTQYDEEKFISLLQSIHTQSSAHGPKWHAGHILSHFGNYGFLPNEIGKEAATHRDIVVRSQTNNLPNWACNSCSSKVPHLHVQKVVWESSCYHLKMMLGSGWKESYSKIIEFPVSWWSLQKLAHWIYSGRLPKPTFDCRWLYFDEFKLKEIYSYIELMWLGDYWLIQSLHEESYMIAVSCLDFSRPVYDQLIEMASAFEQLKLVNEFRRIYNEQKKETDLVP